MSSSRWLQSADVEPLVDESWEAYLRDSFPGYLLPRTARHRVTEESARAFLDALGVRPDDLDLLKLMSVLAGHAEQLEGFACHWLPELVRVLPSRSLVRKRDWRGGFQGRLDVGATLAHRMAGNVDRYVTRTRHRDFNLPENAFVKRLATRTVNYLERLHSGGLLFDDGWTEPVRRSLSSLQSALAATSLREVACGPIGNLHVHAAMHARHPAFRASLEWYRAMQVLDRSEPEELARVLSQGALRPMSKPKCFEVAVLLSLLHGLTRRLPAEEGWTLETRVIATGRKEVALFRRDGAEVAVHYDQAVLPLACSLGPRDSGVAHYLGSAGRLRPDITVRTRSEDGWENFTVFEIKLTEDIGYVATGYGEAIVYRHEYAEYLKRWPKAVVVASCAVPGSVSEEHDVVAVRWSELAESRLLDRMLVGVVG